MSEKITDEAENEEKSDEDVEPVLYIRHKFKNIDQSVIKLYDERKIAILFSNVEESKRSQMKDDKAVKKLNNAIANFNKYFIFPALRSVITTS
nr:hypothetical protein [Candidatus Sigynarchaeota archaeon]